MTQLMHRQWDKGVTLLKTLGTLLLLFILFPVSLLVVSIAHLWTLITAPLQDQSHRKQPPQEAKTVLLTGGKMTKALQLARSFHSSGHRVILVETHKYWLSGHRFSKAVDRFVTVPAPEKDADGYIHALRDIVVQEKADIFIPVSSPVASYYDSLAKPLLTPHCEVLHFDADITQILDDKFTFCEQARLFGLSVPKVFRITDPQQLLKFDFDTDGSHYIIKSIAYNSVYRLDLTLLPCPNLEDYVKQLPISKETPWMMQEFIKGQEYCTHSTVRDGKIQVHCCSKSSPFQVNYEHVDHPEIYRWVSKFVQSLGITGQVSFDFIEADDGTVYPIECNPRTHSAITMFYNHPQLAAAYLGTQSSTTTLPIEPLSNSRPTYWLYHELWRLTNIRSGSQLKAHLKTIATGTDAIFQANDPWPFLMVHGWQIPLLLLKSLQHLKGWIRIDFNIGKLVELGGD